MVATTLKEAFNALDHRQPIRPDEVGLLHVQRPGSPIPTLAAQLRLSQKPQKILFIGHRGAGKSSELAYLTTLVDQTFLPIPVPLYDVFQGPVVSHTEDVFAIALRLLQLATDDKIVATGILNDAWQGFAADYYNWFKQFLFGDAAIRAENQTEVRLKLSVLAAELETSISTDSYTRRQVKEKFAGQVSDLLGRIDQLCELLAEAYERPTLLLIEDLDKFDLATARQLFRDHAGTLTQPKSHIIYSFPVALRYDAVFAEIVQNFDHDYFLPNVALCTRDGTVRKEGADVLWQMLFRRVSSDLFAEGVWEEMIQRSGGLVRILIRMAQQAVLKATVAGSTQIELAHATEAWVAERNDIVVFLREEDLALLRGIHGDEVKDLSNVDSGKQRLLQSGTLLEYADARGPWADAIPIIWPLLAEASS